MPAVVDTTAAGCEASTRARSMLSLAFRTPNRPRRRTGSWRLAPPAPWSGIREANDSRPQAHQLPFPFLDPALASDPVLRCHA